MELSHRHTYQHKYTLAQRPTCASIDMAWSELFHVCPRDFSVGYLSGALCLLDQAGLPTHSHLSEHSSDEITHTGIWAVLFCACVLMWYSLNAANEGGQMSLCVSVRMWVWLRKWNAGFIWNATPVYYYCIYSVNSRKLYSDWSKCKLLDWVHYAHIQLNAYFESPHKETPCISLPF